MKDIRIKRAILLNNLNSAECVEGYFAGFNRKICPDNASLSFIHGWRNGASDKGYRPIDSVQRELAKDVISTKYLHLI